MAKKKVKKRLSVERPYNNGKLSESELRSKILAKLRQFTQYWNPAKIIKTKTIKCAHCGINKGPFDADHINSVVPVDGWKKTDDLFLGYNWNEWLRNALVEEDGFQGLCPSCHKFKTHEIDNKLRKHIKALTKEYEGGKFGRLCVLRGVGKHLVECECDCGEIRRVSVYNLKSGHTRSCGCIMGTHKMSGTKEYKTWTNINSRCNNSNATGYKHYGGRGIKVEWETFEDFYKDMGDIPKGKSIDRINPDGNYSKENCRWATMKEQANNKSTYNHILEFEGERKTISEWADSIGILQNTLLYRIRRGWKVGEALGVDKRIIESREILKEEYLDDILKLIGEGKTQGYVGKIYGVDSSVVSRYLKKYKNKKR